MWIKNERSQKNTQGYILEGNVPIYIFSENPVRVRFLTEDISIEQVMSEMNLVREAAIEYIGTKLIHEKWIQPVSHWEHQIKEIPGKRYFSTVVCKGRNCCPLCNENIIARNNGVSENKLLPYPVRKRFVVPAWFYDMGKILYVRGAEDFFDDISTYINKNGVNSDFDIYKQGRGFNTKYRSIYIGPSPVNELDLSQIILPKNLNFELDEAEYLRRINGGNIREAVQEEDKPQDKSQEKQEKEIVGDFTLPFGSHKGKSLKQLFDLGETDYLEFLSKNSSGLVQEKVIAFMKEIGPS